MRLNKYIAASSDLSRRAADTAIDAGRVTVDGETAVKGTEIKSTSQVKLDGKLLTPTSSHATLILNKPVGYVCSRNGQGSRTVFDLLPSIYHHLNPVGRLDKDSSGLLLMTNDGDLAQRLTHPRYAKTKTYLVALDKPLAPLHQQMITDHGIMLDDGVSQFLVTKKEVGDGTNAGRKALPSSRFFRLNYPVYEVCMTEGRNRQIRRTFAALGYHITTLHRTHFGSYVLADLPVGQHALTP